MRAAVKSVRQLAQQLINAQRKIRARLPLHGENVSPEVPNDVFQAHASIYYFCRRFAAARHVLDLGCGSGYGAPILLSGGATRVVGVDVHRGNIRYARRRFESAAIQYLVGNVEDLPVDIGQFDLIVSSNVFEHLRDVSTALDQARAHLSDGGILLLAVPPITDENLLHQNQDNPFHVSNLFINEWSTLLLQRFAQVRRFNHLPPPTAQLDFGSPFRSNLSPAGFVFDESTNATGAEPTLTAIFVCLT